MLPPAYFADRVLDSLAIENLSDLKLLESIAWERGAIVQHKPLDGAEARLAVVGRRAVITVSSTVSDSRRKRFSIAHELGHLELHRNDSKLAICTTDDIGNWASQQAGTSREQDANDFAAALLLPKRFFAPLCDDQDPSLDLIGKLADTFEVSLTATAIRYTNFTTEACAVVFSQQGYIKWFRGSKEFEDLEVFVDVRSKLDPSSQAASYFQGHSVSPLFKPVRASAWFRPGGYRRDAMIQEQSWPMPNYDAVLTLLRVDEDIEDEDDYL